MKDFAAFDASKREALGVRSQCKPCRRAIERPRLDPEKERARGRRYYEAHKAETAARLRSWRAANRERVRARDNAYNAANPERIRATAKRYYERVKNCPAYRLKAAVKASIHQRLTRGKGGRSTFDALGYSPDELRLHLEGLFEPGMCWENYGRGGWEIDHIVPLSAVRCENIDDPRFRAVWGLSNLRPLWVADNRSKGAKLLAAEEGV